MTAAHRRVTISSSKRCRSADARWRSPSCRRVSPKVDRTFSGHHQHRRVPEGHAM